MMKTDLDILLEAYIELNKLSTSPGETSYRLSRCIKFIEKQIALELKKNRGEK